MPGSWRKALRILSYAAGAAVVAALALVLALPLVVDQPRVKAGLERRLSALVHGTMRWDEMHLQLLPAPKGVMTGLRVEIPQLLRARAARLEAQLRLWPLLRGRVELASLTAVGAEARLDWTPAAGAQPAVGGERTMDPVAAVRAAAGAAAAALDAFAPDTQLAIEHGSLELHLGQLPPLRVHAFELRARSAGSRAQLQLSAAGENWKRVGFVADFDYAARSGDARLEVDDLDLKAWLERAEMPAGLRLTIAPLALRATLLADGSGTLTGQLQAGTRTILAVQGAREYEVPDIAIKASARIDSQLARLRVEELLADGTKLLAGAAQYAYASREASARLDLDVDTARALGIARRVLARAEVSGLQEIEGASGRLRGSVHIAHQAGQWRAGLQLRDADAAFRLRGVPWELQLNAGTVEWQPGVLEASAIHASLGQSGVTDLGARLRLAKALHLESARGKASLDLDELFPWLRAQPALADAPRHVARVNGALGVELVKASGRPAAPDFELRLLPRRIRIQADTLPGPLSVDGGSLRLTRAAAAFTQVAIGILDVRAVLSGSASGIGTPGFQVQARLADGNAGPQAAGWALTRARAPAQLALRTPFAFSAERLDWGPGRRLDARARLRFDEKTSVAADLAWRPGLLELRQLEVQDAHGSSRLVVRAQGKRIEGRLDGTMHGAVLGYFLKEAERFTGSVAGDLRFAAETDRLRHASVEGRLSGEGVELGWLVGRPLRLEKFVLDAEHDKLHIGEAVVRSGKAAATLRGELRRGAQGPIVEATIESEGVVLDDLLAAGKAAPAPAADEAATKRQAEAPAATGKGEPRTTEAARDARRWWPLPVTGRVALRAGFLQQGPYRVSPVAAALTLEAERALLEVEKAQLCGIAMPFLVEARPDGWRAAARIAAPKQPVGELAHCLTDKRVEITGDAEFALDVKTQGRAADLLRNLEGSAKLEVKDGRIQRFALIGNILSLLSITDIPEAARESAAGEEGFRFRRIAGTGQFRDGQFLIEEGVFDSPSARMVAKGTIGLAERDAKITVLVAPIGWVDRVVRGVPVIGYVIGGAVTSIPVGVSGDIRDPRVVPLGPRAVTEELVGIFERTMKLPTKLIPPAATPK